MKRFFIRWAVAVLVFSLTSWIVGLLAVTTPAGIKTTWWVAGFLACAVGDFVADDK